MTYDANGHPAHSWRVLILPFLDQRELYDQYKFAEPWDSPHNSKLAEKKPDIYRCPSFKHHNEENGLDAPHLKLQTNYVAIVGSGTVFGENRTINIDEITDGVGQTLLIAETRQHAVHWMKPEDITLKIILSDLQYSKNDSHASHQGGMHFSFTDGHVHILSADIDPDLIRSLTTYAGKEPINENDY